MADIKENLNQASKGLFLDVYPGNMDASNTYTYAFNARQESEDGNQLNISNEPSNTKGIEFPVGFNIIGSLNIPELNYTVYWLTNPTTKDCFIGTVTNDTKDCKDNIDEVDCGCDCDDKPCISSKPCREFKLVLSAPCLNFSSQHRIKKAVYNITNKTTEIYWTDDYNPPMWIDFQNLPYSGVTGVIDCNLMRIFPDFKVPTIKVVSEVVNGDITFGSYQFFVAYANSKGNEISQYYSPTNPAGIFERGKALKILIENIDIQYKNFNIVVQKNIDNVSSFELCGTFDITSDHFEYSFTDNNKAPRLLTADEVYFKMPYYNKAATLETQSSVLLLGNLTTDEEINYQDVANRIELEWEAWRVPYNSHEAYVKAPNTANIRGYMRDEVYALAAVFLTKNGRYSGYFHIPGRSALPDDLALVGGTDAEGSADDPCSDTTLPPKWQVYNTASVTNYSQGYDPNDNCYVGPYKFGKFAYWESSLTYPNDPTVWGSLAGLPIRHHKFPDELVISRYSSDSTNNIGTEHSIYPLGIKLNPQNIYSAIQKSNLTQEQKDNIVGIKIIRANRSQNKSVQARGLLFNVGSYNYQGKDYLYPNYCFNDLNPDVFISNGHLNSQGAWVSTVPPRTTDYSVIKNNRLVGFKEDGSRYTFMSPDTSFTNPALTGNLRLESVEFGKADAHIVQVQNNPRYTIGTQNGVKVAAMLAVATIFSYDFGFDVATTAGTSSTVTTTPKLKLRLDISHFLPAFATAYDLIKKLTPPEQYGYQYNAVGNYCQTIPVLNDNNKTRVIDVAGYISPTMLTIPGETIPLNNYQRESSVYLRIQGKFPYPHNLGGPVDNSRFTFGSYADETGLALNDGQIIQRDISSFYATIKRNVPDQYGQIYSYPTVDTGHLQYLDINLATYPTVFGGDTFINRFADKRKMPFFTTNTWGLPDDTDVAYDVLGNVGCPTYYLSTSPVDPSVGSIITYFDAIYSMFISLPGILATIVTGGLALFLPVLVGMVQLVIAIVNTLGLKNIVLDRHVDANYFEKGVMYLFTYGIPYFFVESDVNCDYRDFGTSMVEDYYPNVGTDIPDNWLQEKNVSITKDNSHLYNRMYSKQNVENYFDHLPMDYSPNKPLVTHHATRIIYSEPTSLTELQNSWQIFRPNNMSDLPFNNGELRDLNGLEQGRVLALMNDGMSVFNAFITLSTDIKGAIFGNNSMFQNPPQEYSNATLGYGGSQHCVFSKTPYGHFWVDSLRGDVFKYSPNDGLQSISRIGVRNWFKENLPFKIRQYFPNANIDNSYNGPGLAIAWDNRFERLFITKKDFIPLSKEIVELNGRYYLGSAPTIIKTVKFVSGEVKCCPEGYVNTPYYVPDTKPCFKQVNNEKFYADYEECPGKYVSVDEYIGGGPEVSLYDTKYFCDASWTIAYSPQTETWVSLYGFKPDFYVEQISYFQTGKGNIVWDHLLTNKCYQTFYNQSQPFDIETVTKAEAKDQTLSSVAYRNEVLKYSNTYDYRTIPKVTFNEAVCYSINGCSGNLALRVKDKSNMLDGLFPVTTGNSVQIPVSEISHIWHFNRFTDLASGDCNDSLMINSCANDIKEVNPEAIDYSIVNNMTKRKRLKSDWFKIKLRNSKFRRFKFIFKFLDNKGIQTTR